MSHFEGGLNSNLSAEISKIIKCFAVLSMLLNEKQAKMHKL